MGKNSLETEFSLSTEKGKLVFKPDGIEIHGTDLMLADVSTHLAMKRFRRDIQDTSPANMLKLAETCLENLKAGRDIDDNGQAKVKS